VIGLLLDRLELLRPGAEVLHIAPQRGLARWIVQQPGVTCRFIDLEPAGLDGIDIAPGDVDRGDVDLEPAGAVEPHDPPIVERLDLCRDLPSIQDHCFDVIIHSHVLEHLTCNYTAVLAQLRRTMRASATMVCCVPVLPGSFAEDLDASIGPDERTRRFGQHDHVRRFGADDLPSTLGMVVPLAPDYDVRRWLVADDLRRHNIPDHCWTGYTPHSVIVVRADEFLL
jgi:phosphoglycolate phosphatase